MLLLAPLQNQTSALVGAVGGVVDGHAPLSLQPVQHVVQRCYRHMQACFPAHTDAVKFVSGV